MLLVHLLVACAEIPGNDPKDGSPGDSPGDTGAPCTPTEPSPGPKDTGDGPRTARSMSGVIQWDLDFDAAAEAAGLTDCSYTRDYAGFLERTDLAFLCPDCTLVVQGTAVMTAGYADCYAQIDDGASSHVEQLGLIEAGADDIRLFRSGTENVTLAEVGPLIDGVVTWSDTSTTDDGAEFTLHAHGSLTIGEAESTVADPEGARTAPYSCGWPEFNPGGPVESFIASVGTTFPNVRLVDSCEERVDLWDLRGRYVIVDASSPDCGPCQTMASMAEAFKAQMAGRCVDVEIVTLLNAGISEVNKVPDARTVGQWIEQYGLQSPVLADEGFGYAVLAPAINPDGGMSLPSIAALDPEGRVIYLDSGFGETSGYFDPIKAAIFADAGVTPGPDTGVDSGSDSGSGESGAR